MFSLNQRNKHLHTFRRFSPIAHIFVLPGKTLRRSCPQSIADVRGSTGFAFVRCLRSIPISAASEVFINALARFRGTSLVLVDSRCGKAQNCPVGHLSSYRF